MLPMLLLSALPSLSETPCALLSKFRLAVVLILKDQ